MADLAARGWSLSPPMTGKSLWPLHRGPPPPAPEGKRKAGPTGRLFSSIPRPLGQRGKRRLYRHGVLPNVRSAGHAGKHFKQRSDRPADARIWQRVGRLRYSIDHQCANSRRRDPVSKLHGSPERDEVRQSDTLEHRLSISFREYFWPELEVNYTYWPNGIHTGLSQVLLTPGIIFGRFKIGQTPRPVRST